MTLESNAPPPLIVRADAGPRVGLGHLVRSLAVAREWLDRGGRVTLVTTTGPEVIANLDSPGDVQVVSVVHSYPDAAEDLRTVEQAVSARPGCWVLCDGYPFDRSYTAPLIADGARVAVIDDYGHQPVYHADVLLNYNLGADRIEYRFDRETRCLFGPGYALVPQAYLAWRGWDRDIPDRASRILVTLGGADTTLALTAVIRAFRALSGAGVTVTVLPGPNARLRDLQQVASGVNGVSFEFAPEGTSIPGLMARSDLAVSAGGSTVWQLCLMGVPSLLITIAENQVGIARHLDEAGCAVSLGCQSRLTEGAIGEAVQALCLDRAKRESLSERGRRLVDGRGAERTVDALLDTKVVRP